MGDEEKNGDSEGNKELEGHKLSVNFDTEQAYNS